jgi:hypothetical protein
MNLLLCITTYNSKKFLGKLFYYLQQLNPKPTFTLFVSTDYYPFNDLLYIHRNYKVSPYKIINIPFCKDAVKKLEYPYNTIAIVRQTGLEYARKHNYDYIWFNDDDNFPLTPNMFELLTEHGNNYLVGAPYLRVYPDGIFLACKWGTPERGRYILKKIPNYPIDFPVMISGGAMLIPKRIIQDTRLNFYPIHIEYSSSEDYGYCLGARKFGYLCLLDCRVKMHHEYIKTIRDIKPWTVNSKTGEYFEFNY